MKTTNVLSVIAGLALCAPATAQQQSISVSLGLISFPSNGQSAEQQTEDEQACYGWSVQTTGMDPKAPPAQPAQVQQVPQAAGAAAGATRAAAGGALLAAALDEDKSEWAAAAGVLGAARGRRSAQMRNAQAQAQATAQQQEATQHSTEMFKKAFTACMQSKNYSVQ